MPWNLIAAFRILTFSENENCTEEPLRCSPTASSTNPPNWETEAQPKTWTQISWLLDQWTHSLIKCKNYIFMMDDLISTLVSNFTDTIKYFRNMIIRKIFGTLHRGKNLGRGHSWCLRILSKSEYVPRICSLIQHIWVALHTMFLSWRFSILSSSLKLPRSLAGKSTLSSPCHSA